MDDAAYKRLFSRPGMVRDLLRGFAARDWSEALDFASLTPLPASYVSRDLQQRHGDLVWRIRFGGERWLYLLLLLEFQSGVDRAMAVRMLTYSGLLYQRLVAEGVLRERGGRRGAVAVSAIAAILPAGRRPGGRRLAAAGQPDVGADRAGDEPRPVAVVGAAEHVDRAVAGAGRRGVDGRVHRLGCAGAAAAADAGDCLGASRGSNRAASRNARCSVARRRASSTPTPGSSWPPHWRR